MHEKSRCQQGHTLYEPAQSPSLYLSSSGSLKGSLTYDNTAPSLCMAFFSVSVSKFSHFVRTSLILD